MRESKILYPVWGLALCLIFFADSALGQELMIPQPSTTERLEQEFGLGAISVTYSRPNLKGRKIFGQVEPFGQVWTTGANGATRVKLTDSIRIEGHWLPPGEYALFTVPDKEVWTVIFNRSADQWGAYAYDPSKDILRFDCQAGKSDHPVETFTLQFANATDERCDMILSWEKVVLVLHLVIDVDAQVMAHIDQAIHNNDKPEDKPYYESAIYYYNHDKDIRQALAWMETYDRLFPGHFNIKYWLARVQLRAGDKKAALASATEGLALAVKRPNAEYIRMNQEIIAQASAP